MRNPSGLPEVGTRQRITKPSGLAKEEIGGCGAMSIEQGNALCRSGLLPVLLPRLRFGWLGRELSSAGFQRSDAKSTHSPTTLRRPGSARGDSMPDIQI